MKTNQPKPYANTGYGARLTLIDIGLKGRVAALNGDTAFWSVAPLEEVAKVLGRSEPADVYSLREAELRSEMETLRSQILPSAVYLNPTDRCNLNCEYCYLPDEMRRRGSQMKLDDMRRAITVLKNHFAGTLPSGFRPQLVFHGSEPLLARDVIFAAIEEYGEDFRIGIQTNATLLDREAIDFLTKNGVGIGISLDAHTAEIADAARKRWNGGGTFKQTVKVMRHLADYPALNVISTVTSANVRSLSDVVEFFHAEGISTAMLNPVRCTRAGGRNLKPDNDLLAKEFIKALDLSQELYRRTGRKLVIANFANIITAIVAPTARRLMCDISPCGGGRCFFAVSAAGDVFPCSEFIGLTEFKGGNLFDQNIGEILTSDPFARITSRRVEDFEPCAGCAIRHFCGAPCPAEVYACEGTLKVASSYCRFYEEQVRYAFRLIAAGKEADFLWDDWEETTSEIFSL